MDKIKIGILGSGTMGKQIALLCASHGLPATLWNHVSHPELIEDINKMALVQSRLGTVDKNIAETCCKHIEIIDKIVDLKDCDIFIEAVKEDIYIKSSVLSELSSIIDDNKIVSTNTSTLSITKLASLFTNPSRFIGVHFFNPLFSLKLVEVVRGEYTSEETIIKTEEFIKILQKSSVVLPETPGFVVNRLLFPLINEAVFLLAEGIADAKTIDNCMKLGANHPMGPLELADLIGLDVCLSILETLVVETGDDKYRAAPLLRKKVRAGKLGRKSGIGFHTYRKKT